MSVNWRDLNVTGGRLVARLISLVLSFLVVSLIAGAVLDASARVFFDSIWGIPAILAIGFAVSITVCIFFWRRSNWLRRMTVEQRAKYDNSRYEWRKNFWTNHLVRFSSAEL